MSTPLSLYPVDSNSSILTNAALLLGTSGGTTTAAPTTLVGTSLGWGEIAFSGNSGPWAAATSEPNPTGFGACFDASSSVLIAQMILAGNWSGVLKLFNTGTSTTLGMDHLKLRFWKWTSGTPISSATAIGSIDLGSQTTSNTAASYTFPSTSESAMNFAPSGNDYLYIDLVAHLIATGTANTTSTTKIKMDTGAASTTQGNANYNIATAGYQPTPVLVVASSTLSFSATAGGANPASQTDNLSETAGTSTAWTSAIVYGSGSGWLAISPTSDTLAASGNENITFTCTTGSLAAGTYTATVTFTATTGGNTVTVSVTFTVNPSGTLVYSDSPYGTTIYVSSQKTALSYDRLQLFASYTNGGTIPYYVRWQYSWKYIETSQDSNGNPVYGGWGPLDETVDKINATPGLRLLLNLAYAPSWWLRLDSSGNDTGAYGSANAVLPDGPAMARFASAVAQRYGNRIAVYQVGNEEYDTGLSGGGIGGKILAQTFNYAVPAIQQYSSSPIITGAIRRLAPGGAHVSQWMNNFFGYVPKSGEPAQALPYAMDFHYYRDGSNITSNGNPASDPTTTDNSQAPGNATTPDIAGEISIMAGILAQYSPNTQIWCLENGYGLPNNSPNNKNSSPSEIPTQQSRYDRDAMAQMHAAGGSKYFYYTFQTSGNDPKSMCGSAISDLVNYITATPQWVGTPAPTQYLYTSVDALSFSGTTSTKPLDQYFSIMNPTGSALAWSLSSNQSWLTAATLPTNGMSGNQGANLTSGTLAAGQRISLKCTADSTVAGLTQLTVLTGTLTLTIGANNYTITVSLFVLPTAASPNITSASAGPGNGPTFNMTVNGSTPANQTVSFTNQDAYSCWWFAFVTGDWLSINTASGTLAALSNQNLTISMNSTVVSTLAPGTYNEVVTIAATPNPATYTTDNPPAQTQFITIIVKLVIAKSSTPAVQLSTSTFNFSAVASGSLPASQTFYLHNCRNAANNWTATKTQSWLTLSPTSGSNLPANGSTTGTSPNIQATDYAIVTASINTTALAAGTYTDTITVTLGGTATATIAVSYVVSGSGSTLTIGASPTSLSLSQVQGGANVSGSVTLTNSGTQTGTFTSATNYTVGSGWIKSISPGSGTLTGGGGTQTVTITCQTGSRTPGTYTATVTFTLGTSTATVSVTFTITSPSTGAIISVSPTQLAFSDALGGGNPAPQILTLSNTGSAAGNWTATVSYSNGMGWLTLSATSGSLTAGGSGQVSVFVDDTTLSAGTYPATITFVMGSSQATATVTFTVTPAPPGVVSFSGSLMSLAIFKTQVVKVYDANGHFLNVWRDAPLLTGLKSTMNAADQPVRMTLPRQIDNFGGAGQPGTDNTVVLGNTVQIWLYGPGLPSSGLLKFNGVIDTIEPTITDRNEESVTVTLVPYAAAVADHGYVGTLTFTNVDPIALFSYWFLNNDPTSGLGNVPYSNPLTLSPSSATSSGLQASYTVNNQNLKSVFDTVMLMLGAGWYWRANPDKSTVISQTSPVAQHTIFLGEHLSSLSYSSDNSQRKNVIRFIGASGISATAVGASAKPPGQGGIGERILYAQDSRITDNNTAGVIANGLLSIYDQPLVRTKCTLVDYRGDTKTQLGYDIESVLVGDTITIKDARGKGKTTTWGNFKWGQAQYGLSPGAAFNTVVPVLALTYNWNTLDLEIGSFQPSQDRALFKIRQALQDFTVAQ